jgi:ABC-2 type transport system ATP-binding protein
LGHQDEEIRRHVGVLPEAPGLYDALSAEQNLAFFGALYEVDDLAGQVERYLRLLGLWERRRDPVSTFSRGMRQKLAIARALLHEPKVLFLDEPTSGLDPEAARLVRDFIAELRGERRTIFLCTHNLNEAGRLCDRIAIINTRLLALDTPAELRRKLYGRTVVFHLSGVLPEYLAQMKRHPFVRSVRAVDNKLVVDLDEPERRNPLLIRELVEAGAEIQFVGELRRSLEDIYLHLLRAAPN